MKTNIGKAITLLNEVKTPLPSHQQKITEAITLLKHEDEARQPLVPQKFSDDAMLNSLSREQLIHIVKCTEACLAKNNGEHSALCAVAEHFAAIVTDANFKRACEIVPELEAIAEEVAAVRGSKAVQS